MSSKVLSSDGLSATTCRREDGSLRRLQLGIFESSAAFSSKDSLFSKAAFSRTSTSRQSPPRRDLGPPASVASSMSRLVSVASESALSIAARAAVATSGKGRPLPAPA